MEIFTAVLADELELTFEVVTSPRESLAKASDEPPLDLADPVAPARWAGYSGA